MLVLSLVPDSTPLVNRKVGTRPSTVLTEAIVQERMRPELRSCKMANMPVVLWTLALFVGPPRRQAAGSMYGRLYFLLCAIISYKTPNIVGEQREHGRGFNRYE